MGLNSHTMPVSFASRTALPSLLVSMVLWLVAGCSSLPPAATQPKPVTRALDSSPDTALGKAFDALTKDRGSDSGFRLISTGIDGLTARLEMIDASQRSIDVQSYIFRADNSGNLVVQALLRAADRGVRIRILVDDGETVRGDERILALAAHDGFEVRIYNPLRYRGHERILRGAEFLFNKSRLDYRMHNKLMVADSAVAIIGGRNIGDQYFQIDPESQFGDDDLVVAGPIVRRLSGVFDEFWNAPIAIPAQAFDKRDTSERALSDYQKILDEYRQRLAAKQPDKSQAKPKQPFTDIASGNAPLHWAPFELVYDSPDKKDTDKGTAPGRLIYKALVKQANAVSTELLIVTPYFIPSPDELAALAGERERHARVRVLTNSLEAAPSAEAHSGYMHYRTPLLEEGVELYELRALLGDTRGSGEGKAIANRGNYALHAKLFVFDRRIAFVGSMNFDQRSKHLNTEIGLLIASPELAAEITAHFDAWTQLDNSYAVTLSEGAKGTQHLIWSTREAGQLVHYETEPAKNAWQRTKVRFLTLLPLDKEL
jgi:putative cardiolipin synthase